MQLPLVIKIQSMGSCISSKSESKLYKIRVIEEKGERVKVHYIGFSE